MSHPCEQYSAPPLRPGCFLELRSAEIGKEGLLPSLGREVPIACAGFVVVAGGIRDGGAAPIIHAHLQQSAVGNLDPGSCGAAFELATGERRARRGAPEMPDAIGPLADIEDDGVARRVVRDRHGLEAVAGKPGLADIKPAAELAGVIVQDDVVAVNAAG